MAAGGWRGFVTAAVLGGCAGCASASRPGLATGAAPRIEVPVACEASPRDADQDSLDDACEYALAAAFAPELVVSTADCAWGGAGARRLAGGYLFAARREGAGVRLAYLPAYARDCGWRDWLCLRPGGGCGRHDGDSELLLLDVVPSGGGNWRLTGLFLSSHCLGRQAARCRWYRDAGLTEVQQGADGAVRVWVARDKHAHYPSAEACAQGHRTRERCDGPVAHYRFPLQTPAQNIGSRAFPHPRAGGCWQTAELPVALWVGVVAATECMWDPARPFRGWQGTTAGPAPTAYALLLHWFGGF